MHKHSNYIFFKYMMLIMLIRSNKFRKLHTLPTLYNRNYIWSENSKIFLFFKIEGEREK